MGDQGGEGGHEKHEGLEGTNVQVAGGQCPVPLTLGLSAGLVAPWCGLRQRGTKSLPRGPAPALPSAPPPESGDENPPKPAGEHFADAPWAAANFYCAAPACKQCAWRGALSRPEAAPCAHPVAEPSERGAGRRGRRAQGPRPFQGAGLSAERREPPHHPRTRPGRRGRLSVPLQPAGAGGDCVGGEGVTSRDPPPTWACWGLSAKASSWSSRAGGLSQPRAVPSSQGKAKRVLQSRG